MIKSRKVERVQCIKIYRHFGQKVPNVDNSSSKEMSKAAFFRDVFLLAPNTKIQIKIYIAPNSLIKRDRGAKRLRVHIIDHSVRVFGVATLNIFLSVNLMMTKSLIIISIITRLAYPASFRQ